MRPHADGPGNLADALNWAAHTHHCAVFVVCALAKCICRKRCKKLTTESVDAFTSGPQVCFASKQGEQWHIHRDMAATR
jgi:L-asparaginase/Glu-tRNA(Gln) amidotransferase subunit D